MYLLQLKLNSYHSLSAWMNQTWPLCFMFIRQLNLNESMWRYRNKHVGSTIISYFIFFSQQCTRYSCVQIMINTAAVTFGWPSMMQALFWALGINEPNPPIHSVGCVHHTPWGPRHRPRNPLGSHSWPPDPSVCSKHWALAFPHTQEEHGIERSQNPSPSNHTVRQYCNQESSPALLPQFCPEPIHYSTCHKHLFLVTSLVPSEWHKKNQELPKYVG